MEEGKEYTIQDFCNLLNLKPSRTKELLKALTQDIEQIGNNKKSKIQIKIKRLWGGNLQMQSAYIHLYLIMINVITFCIVWTRQMESDDKTVEGQREKIDHTCTDRRLHWSTDRYDSISS